MALNFQYNKTFLQELNKGLKVRENALPTLVSKETALRLEVKRARAAVVELEAEYQKRLDSLAPFEQLWGELPLGLVELSESSIETGKVAGVKVPLLKKLELATVDFGPLGNPSWFGAGVEILRSLAELKAKTLLAQKKVAILEHARKKTTQKVNLYEKVQIPEYKEGILKIKRFMEDEENLAKSAQKILKSRLALAEENARQEEAA